ncbi:MAG: Cna B-type domain-containing protein [Candidatus Limivicinus sp.]|jgi:hypothetical protein
MKRKSNGYTFKKRNGSPAGRRSGRSIKLAAFLALLYTLSCLMLPGYALEDKAEPGAPGNAEGGGAAGKKIMVCSLESFGVHQHDESCYDADGNLICGKADYVLHTHDESCYDENGELICTLPEIKGTPHIHDESCYREVRGKLICGLEETEGHTHDESCYDGEGNLICGLKEQPPHHHDESCYEHHKELCCGMIEVQEHVHSDSCFKEIKPEAEPGPNSAQPGGGSGPEVQSPAGAGEGGKKEVLNTFGSPGLRSAPPESGDGPKVPCSPADMTDMITAVMLKHKSGSGDWQNVAPEIGVDETDSILFRLEYTVPGKTLSPECSKLKYQLPSAVKLGGDSGLVYNMAGDAVGTYTISGGGGVEVDFYDDYAKQNSNGGDIVGTLSFIGNLENSGEEETTDVELKFSDKVNLTVKVKNHKEAEGDISVVKYLSGEKQDGRLPYQIVVTSIKGTWDKVHLTDVMTGAKIENVGELTVKDKNGTLITPVEIKIDAEGGGSSFSMTLPQMAAGDSYTINYPAVIDSSKLSSDSRSASAVNKVSVKSKDSLGNDITSSAKIDKIFDLVQKSGVYDAETDTVSWRVVINNDGLDISGWHLWDEISGAGEVRQVKICGSDKVEKEITLPYIFPEGSTDTYVITYTSKPVRIGIGELDVTNYIYLGRDETLKGRISWASETVNVGKAEAVKKWAVSEPALVNGVVVTRWNVSICGMEGINEQIIVKDTVPDDKDQKQYMTRTQLESARQSAEEAMNKDGIESGSWQVYLFGSYNPQPWDTVSPNQKYQGFQFEILTKKPREDILSFSYESSADAGSGSMDIVNEVSVLNDVIPAVTRYDQEKISLHKTDPEFSGKEESEHYLDKLKDGLMRWQIDLFVPEGRRTEDLTLTDSLPPGAELVNIKFYPGQAGKPIVPDGGWKTGSSCSASWWLDGGKKITVSAELNDNNQLILNIPKEMSGSPECGGHYKITVVVKPEAEKIDWPGDGLIHRYPMKNSAAAESGGESATDSQTQVLVKNDMIDFIGKDCALLDNDTVRYTLNINPHGLDILPGADYLTLTDTMSHGSNSALAAYLVPGSVKINGEPFMDYDYAEYQDKPAAGQNQYVLKFRIPDSRALSIVYDYRFTGFLGSKCDIHNEAVLEGWAEDGGSVSKDTEFKLKESSGTADIRGIRVYKADIGMQGKYLPGAEFELYRWDGKTSAYIPQLNSKGENLYRSSEGGCLDLSPVNLKEAVYNAAYKLVETKAPPGYVKNSIPYYFIVEHENTEKYPLQEPEDFSGVRLHDGSLVYFYNEKDIERISVPVIKKWIGPAAESVTVNLLADGVKADSCKLSAENNWQHTFVDLPKYKDGKEIVYTVKEEVPAGYSMTITGSAETGFTVTNTISGKTSVGVTKKWIGPAAESVTVNLLADGEIADSCELSAENNWQHTFVDLPKYKSGKEIVYTVEEEVPAGYSSAVTGTAETGFIVTNTISGKTSVGVTKKWVGPPAESVTVNLLADGEIADSFELSAENSWQHTFEDLPKYKDGKEIVYTVKEEVPAGYSMTVTGSAETGFTVTNTISGKTSVGVTKKWVGPPAESVTVNLLADGVKADSCKLSPENSWQYTFEDLPKYKDGKKIVYTVKEEVPAGYSSAVTGTAKTGFTVTNTNTEEISIPVTKQWVGSTGEKVEIILLADGQKVKRAELTRKNQWQHTFEKLPKYDSKTGLEIKYTLSEVKTAGYSTTVTGSAETGFTVTNTISGKTSVGVTKKWVGPAAESVTVNLLADGKIADGCRLSAENSWQHTFKNLPMYNNGKEIVYTVKEETPAGYTGKVTGSVKTGFIVTNTITGEISIPVTKQWVGSTGEKAEIILLADGQEVKREELTKENQWQHTFEKLPKYKDGKEIVYTVKEKVPAGYSTTITGSAETGFTVTNTIIGKTSVGVTKQWVGAALESVTVNLLADGETVDSCRLSAENSWQYTFKDLARYKDGKEIVYTVEEIIPAGYFSSITGTDSNSFTLTNTAAYTPKPPPYNPNKPPKMGDEGNAVFWAVLCTASLGAAAALVVSLLKHKKK